jgi:hypothetical protein
MKPAISVMVVVSLCILAGCASSGGYRSDITVSPAPEAGLYDINFVIEDFSSSAKTRNHRVRMREGEKAAFSVGDEINGCFCTAIVHKTSGTLTLDKTTSIKKDGVMIWFVEIDEPLSQ